MSSSNNRRPRSSAGRAPDRVRLAAARILAQWIRGHEHMDKLLAAYEARSAAEGGWDYVERRRLRELLYGSLRLKGRYDRMVELRRRKGGAPSPEVAAILQLALHEIVEMRSPDHAVVDEAVRCCHALKQKHATGFVNALLRRVLREGPTFAFPPREKDARAHAETWLSMPRWLVDRWADQLGESEMLALCEQSNRRAALNLRVRADQREEQLARLSEAGWSAEPSGWSAQGICCGPGVPAPLALRELSKDGHAVAVQDEAAQLVAPLIASMNPGRVLDLCAAPGGKISHLAELLPEARLVGLELAPRRLEPLQATARAIGERCTLVAADGRRAPFLPASFDAVLVDAPCSGTGVLARRHEARWEREPEDLPRLASLQSSLVLAALDLVRPGGVVVYATCSIEPEENDAVVDSVLAARQDVEEMGVEGLVPDELIRGGRLAVWPHRHSCDGAFAARLRRRGDES